MNIILGLMCLAVMIPLYRSVERSQYLAKGSSLS